MLYMVCNVLKDIYCLDLITIPDIFDIFVSTCLICCFQDSSLCIINPKNLVLLTCSTVYLLISISKLLGFFFVFSF